MTVWNTIDDSYSNYYPLYRNEAIFLDFCLFLPSFKFMTVWNTIDDRYSNFVFFIERKPHSLIFTSFEINFIVFLVLLLRSKPIAQCDNDRDRKHERIETTRKQSSNIFETHVYLFVPAFSISVTILQTNREKRPAGLSKERSDKK